MVYCTVAVNSWVHKRTIHISYFKILFLGLHFIMLHSFDWEWKGIIGIAIWYCCTISQLCTGTARSNFFKLPLLWNEARYDKKAKIKFIDLLKIELFYFVLFLRISLRFKVTEVQKIGARNTLLTDGTRDNYIYCYTGNLYSCTSHIYWYVIIRYSSAYNAWSCASNKL